MNELIDDPQLVADLAAQAMAEPEKVIVTVPPSASEVELPGGLITVGGSLIKYAEIRELNGADEEAIAKSGSTARALNTILQRGLVSLGGMPVNPSNFDDLLMGDRDMLLLAIRKITFGNTVNLRMSCRSCYIQNDIEVDLEKDVKIVYLNDPLDRRFTVDLKSGTAEVSLPNGVTHKKLIDNADKTASEITTIIIASCLTEVNGEFSYGTSTALSLGILDREKIVTEIYSRTPGPRLGEVSKACEACGASIAIPLGLADLFRL